MAFHLTIPTSPTVAEIQKMADKLQRSTARVVVVFAKEVNLLDLFSEVSISVEVLCGFLYIVTHFVVF